jgi:hypothetical protein
VFTHSPLKWLPVLFFGIRRPERGFGYPPPFRADVKEGLHGLFEGELYLFMWILILILINLVCITCHLFFFRIELNMADSYKNAVITVKLYVVLRPQSSALFILPSMAGRCYKNLMPRRYVLLLQRQQSKS